MQDAEFATHRFCRDVRAAVRKARQHARQDSMLIELLMRAADVHQAQLIDGMHLSRDDFLGWAGDCWDRQEAHRKTHEATATSKPKD